MGQRPAYHVLEGHSIRILPRSRLVLRKHALALFAALTLTCYLVYYAPFPAGRISIKHNWPLSGTDESISQLPSQSPVTIITAFFPLKSKHSTSSYNQWLRNFMTKVSGPMIVYTTQSYASQIATLRKGFEHLTTVIADFDNIWDLPPNRNYSDIYAVQHKMDPEKHHHTPALYAVWAAKLWMVVQATELNPFNSSYFFWVDAGSFRDKAHPYRLWPDPITVDEIWKGGPERRKSPIVGLINSWGSLNQFKNVQESEPDRLLDRTADRIEGGWFGGPTEAITWWAQEFYRLRDKYAEMGIFIGKDQLVHNAIALLNPQRVLVLETYKNANLPTCKLDPWFAFQNYLAHESERVRGCPHTPALSLDEAMGRS
ncbi:hypothetical protein SpCBS45565_g07993 [Spizellomyces sp. 'palustris']|nr:hypothetical protein SpCBS45565_g07993 [Spizellomyces sp. 'palustris']